MGQSTCCGQKESESQVEISLKDEKLQPVSFQSPSNTLKISEKHLPQILKIQSF